MVFKIIAKHISDVIMLALNTLIFAFIQAVNFLSDFATCERKYFGELVQHHAVILQTRCNDDGNER